MENCVNTQRVWGWGMSTVQVRLKGLSVGAREALCQQLPPNYEEKVDVFWKFVQAKICH